MHSWFKACDGPVLKRNSVVLTLTIILLGVSARPQSVAKNPVSANDLARRVITNELTFQSDHTNWMYRLEKEQDGKKRVEEIVDTEEGSLTRLLSINGVAPSEQSWSKREKFVAENRPCEGNGHKARLSRLLF